MALIKLAPTWQVLTDGTNNAIVSAPGTTLLYIGAAAPTQQDAGIPYAGEKIQVGTPAKSWIRTADIMPVDAVLFTF